MKLGGSSRSTLGPSTKIKKALSPPIKKKKEVKVEDEEEDVEQVVDEIEDAEPDDVQRKSLRKSKQLALASAPRLGIQSFEVGAEEFLPEGIDVEQRYDNRRANDEKIAAPSKVGGANENKVRGLTTLFGQRSDQILRLLDNEEETDGALTLIHRTLLQTLVDVLPVVERSVRVSKGRRGVIPLNQVVSQVRELVTDIQALREKGEMGAAIVERTMRPAYLDLASQIAVAFLDIENSARSRMSEEDFATYRTGLESTKRNLAKYIFEQYESVKNDVTNSFS
jgi:hypothetical protein